MDIFTPHTIRYKINSKALYRARVARHVTQQAFADRCGWTSAYQWKLETNYPVVSQDTKEIVEEVLKNL